MISIAIDLGGTKIKIGIVKEGRVLAWSSIDAYSEKGLLERLPIIEQQVNMLLNKVSAEKTDVAGVAFATPGLVDTNEMKLISINDKFSDALDFDFKMWAKMRWGTSLALENDARAALAGEWQYGAGRGYDNVVGLTLGTGIGTSAVMNGSLVRGKHFQAGILGGHFIVNVNGTPCNCGNIGCAEAEASTWSLAEKARKHPQWAESSLSQEEIIDYKNVFLHAQQKDPLAAVLMNHSMDIWAATVINMIHAYDPEIVILNGGVMGSADVIIPYIQDKVNKQAWLGWGNVKIVKAENMDNAALLGAAYLASILKN
ncbi:MAG: ROK family protein [Bacteroidales bacterium]|nr:ROK family protein [Bacteroidales bacterium]MCF8332925.1 ROK family protein [Bacteroidales bacterium]